MATDQVAMVATIGGMGPLERQCFAPSGMAKHRIDHDTVAVFGQTDNFVTHNKRE